MMVENTNTLRGLATLNFFAANHRSVKQLYSTLLGFPPYFERPGYREFRIGDYQRELGIIYAKCAPHGTTTPGGTVVYWHVNDVQVALDKLISLGAKPHEKLMVRGLGFVTASVIDPFGNVLGIMYNRHYLGVLNQITEEVKRFSKTSIVTKRDLSSTSAKCDHER